jgi:hypothetical protein
MSFTGTGAAGYLYGQRMRAQAQEWQQQIWDHQAAQAEQNATNGADDMAQDYYEDVDTTDPGEQIYAALTSGDAGTVALGADALLQVYGEQAADHVIGELAIAYSDAYGEQAASEWLDAAGYEPVEDDEAVIMTAEEVADLLDAEITQMEEERGEEFSLEEVEEFVNSVYEPNEEGVTAVETEPGEEFYDPEAAEDFETEPTAEEIVEEQVEALQTKLGRELSIGELERMRGHVDEHASVQDAFEWFGRHPGDRVEEQKFGAAADENIPAPSRHERLAAATEKLVDTDPDYNLELAAQAMQERHAKADEHYENTHRYLAEDVEVSNGHGESLWDAA